MKFVYIVSEARDYSNDIIDGVFTSEEAVKTFYETMEDFRGSFEYGSFTGVTSCGRVACLDIRKVSVTE